MTGLRPTERHSESSFLAIDLRRLGANLSRLLDKQADYFSVPLDAGEWTLILEDGKISERVSPEEAIRVLTECPADAEQFHLRLLAVKRTSHMGLELQPEEYITVTVDFARRAFQFWVSILGEANAKRTYEIVTSGLDLLMFYLPPKHRYLEQYVRDLLSDHSPLDRNVFLIMRFKDAKPFPEIVDVIRDVCTHRNLNVLRADEKAYTEDLWDNVMTYMYGSAAAIAVFDQINYREFNPNVALEVGFMLAQCKKVLLLKDMGISVMPSDIVGRIYSPFNSYELRETIAPQVEKWLGESGFGA